MNISKTLKYGTAVALFTLLPPLKGQAQSLTETFHCNAGDITYSIYMTILNPSVGTVKVTVGESMDQSLNRQFVLNKIAATSGVKLTGQDARNGLTSFTASGPYDGRISFSDDSSYNCEYETPAGFEPQPNDGKSELQRRDEENRARSEQLSRLKPLYNVIGYSLGGKMRSQPSPDFNSRARIDQGNRVEIIGRTEMIDNGYTWYKVRAGSKTGFMWGGELCYAYEKQPGLYGSCRSQGIDIPRKWMVIATDNKSRAREGVHIDRRQAQKIALRACGSNCEIVNEGQAICHAYARSRKEGYYIGVATGDSYRQTRRAAKEYCEGFAAVKGTCKARITTCQE